MAGWGHTDFSPLNLIQPDLDSTPTAGNTSQSIHFSNGSEENNSPPSDVTAGSDPSFPSVINDISSIGNPNHRPSSELNPSGAHNAHNAHDVAATDKNDDVSSVGNRSRVSAHSIAHSLATSMKDSLLRPFQHRQGSVTSDKLNLRFTAIASG